MNTIQEQQMTHREYIERRKQINNLIIRAGEDEKDEVNLCRARFEEDMDELEKEEFNLMLGIKNRKRNLVSRKKAALDAISSRYKEIRMGFDIELRELDALFYDGQRRKWKEAKAAAAADGEAGITNDKGKEVCYE